MSARHASKFLWRFTTAIMVFTFLSATVFLSPGNLYGETYYTHNGQAFFPISTYRTPWGNDQLISLQELKDAGINNVHMYHSRVRQDTLDQLAGYNMTARCYINALVRYTSKFPEGVPPEDTILGQFIDGIDDHPALYDYETTDEAYWHFVLGSWGDYPSYTRDQLIRAKNVVLAIDSSRKIMCNFADHLIAVQNGCTLGGFQSWKEIGTSWGMDIYPVWTNYPNNDLNRIGNGCEYMKSIVGANQPFTMILQADGVQTTVAPNITELRFMVFTSIIHGAKGITWYNLPVSDLTSSNQIWQNAKTVTQELSALKGPLTTGTTNNSTRSASAGLEYTCKTYGGVKYLIVANKTSAQISNAYINISDWSNQYVEVMFRNQVLEKTSGNIYMGNLEAWGVRIFKGLVIPSVTSPSPGSTLGDTTVTFQWPAGVGVEQYALDIGSSKGATDIFTDAGHTNLSQTVSGLPHNGSTVWVRLRSRVNGSWNYYNDVSYTSFTAVPPQLTSPPPGSTLPGSTVTFSWTAGTGIERYALDVGTAKNLSDIYDEYSHTYLSRTVTGIPTDGSTIWVRLCYRIDGRWYSFSKTYTAFKPGPPALYSPTPGSKLSGSTVTFKWTAGTGVERYAIDVGTSKGAHDIYDEYSHTKLSRTVSGIPIDGSTIWVRLNYRINGAWSKIDYSYTALTPVPPVLTTPTPGSTLPGSTVTFKWTAGKGIERYAIDVGSSPGASDIYDEYSHTNLSRTVTGIPTDGRTIWVRLLWRIDGKWSNKNYSYTAKN